MGPALPDRLYLEFRSQDRYLEKLAAFNSNQVNMTGAGEAASISACYVTSDYLLRTARPVRHSVEHFSPMKIAPVGTM